MVLLVYCIITCECVWECHVKDLQEACWTAGVFPAECCGAIVRMTVGMVARMFARPTYVGDNITLVI